MIAGPLKRTPGASKVLPVEGSPVVLARALLLGPDGDFVAMGPVAVIPRRGSSFIRFTAARALVVRAIRFVDENGRRIDGDDKLIRRGGIAMVATDTLNITTTHGGAEPVPDIHQRIDADRLARRIAAHRRAPR